jgi:hypothetical protein
MYRNKWFSQKRVEMVMGGWAYLESFKITPLGKSWFRRIRANKIGAETADLLAAITIAYLPTNTIRITVLCNWLISSQ